jgi:hypothetical protein
MLARLERDSLLRAVRLAAVVVYVSSLAHAAAAKSIE